MILKQAFWQHFCRAAAVNYLIQNGVTPPYQPTKLILKQCHADKLVLIVNKLIVNIAPK